MIEGGQDRYSQVRQRAMQARQAQQPGEQIQAPKELGFTDALSEAFSSWGDAAELLPYVGTGFEANEQREIWNAVNAAQKGEATPEQEKMVLDWVNQNKAKKGMGYYAGSLLVRAPGYAIEFATGGLLLKGAAKKLGFKAASKGLKEAAEGAAADIAKRSARRAAQTSALRRVGGKAATAPIKAGALLAVNEGIQQGASMLFPGEGGGRVDISAYQRALSRAGIDATVDEAGEIAITLAGTLEDYTEAMPAAVMDMYIEYLSEMTGGAFKYLGKLPAVDRLTLGQIGALKWLKGKTMVKPGGLVDELFKRGGWNGILPEWGEERIGGFLRATLGGTVGMAEAGEEFDLENVVRQTFADFNVDQLAGELLGFAAFGAGRAGVGMATSSSKERQNFREAMEAEERFSVRMGREPVSSGELALFRELEKREESGAAPTQSEAQSVEQFHSEGGTKNFDLPDVNPEGATPEETEKFDRLRGIRAEFRDKGFEVTFFENQDGGVTTDAGAYLGNGRILIPHDLQEDLTHDDIRANLRHEVVHASAQESAEGFAALEQVLRDMGYGERLKTLGSAYESAYFRAHGQLLPERLRNEEAIANMSNAEAVLFMLNDVGATQVLSDILQRDRTLFERVMDFFVTMANKMGFTWADSRQREAIKVFPRLAERATIAGQKLPPVTQTDLEAVRAVSSFLQDVEGNLRIAGKGRFALQRRLEEMEAERPSVARQPDGAAPARDAGGVGMEEGMGAMGMQAPRALRGEEESVANQRVRTAHQKMLMRQDKLRNTRQEISEFLGGMSDTGGPEETKKYLQLRRREAREKREYERAWLERDELELAAQGGIGQPVNLVHRDSPRGARMAKAEKAFATYGPNFFYADRAAKDFVARSLRANHPGLRDEVGLRSASYGTIVTQLEKKFPDATHLSEANARKILSDVPSEELKWASPTLDEFIAAQQAMRPDEKRQVSVEDLKDWALNSQMMVYTQTLGPGERLPGWQESGDPSTRVESDDELMSRIAERRAEMHMRDLYLNEHTPGESVQMYILRELSHDRPYIDEEYPVRLRLVAAPTESNANEGRYAVQNVRGGEYTDIPYATSLVGQEAANFARDELEAFYSEKFETELWEELGDIANETTGITTSDAALDTLASRYGYVPAEGQPQTHWHSSYVTPMDRLPESYREQMYTIGVGGEYSPHVSTSSAHEFQRYDLERRGVTARFDDILMWARYWDALFLPQAASGSVLGGEKLRFRYLTETQSDYDSNVRKKWTRSYNKHLYELQQQDPSLSKKKLAKKAKELADANFTTPGEAASLVETHVEEITKNAHWNAGLQVDMAAAKGEYGLIAYALLQADPNYALSGTSNVPSSDVAKAIVENKLREMGVAEPYVGQEFDYEGPFLPGSTPGPSKAARLLAPLVAVGMHDGPPASYQGPNFFVDVERNHVNARAVVNEFETGTGRIADYADALQERLDHLKRAFNGFAVGSRSVTSSFELSDRAYDVYLGLGRMKNAIADSGRDPVESVMKARAWGAGTGDRPGNLGYSDIQDRHARMHDLAYAEEVRKFIELAEAASREMLQTKDEIAASAETAEYNKALEVAEKLKDESRFVFQIRQSVRPDEATIKREATTRAKADMDGFMLQPFLGGEWMSVVAKSMIIGALKDGMDGFAWIDSEQAVENYHNVHGREGYENIYDNKFRAEIAKIVNPFGLTVKRYRGDGARKGTHGVEFNDAIKEHFKEADREDLAPLGRFASPGLEAEKVSRVMQEQLETPISKGYAKQVGEEAREFTLDSTERAQALQDLATERGVPDAESLDQGVMDAAIYSEYSMISGSGVRPGNATDFKRWAASDARKIDRSPTEIAALDRVASRDVSEIIPHMPVAKSVRADGSLEADFEGPGSGEATWGVMAADGDDTQKYMYIAYNVNDMGVLPQVPESATALPADTPTYMAGFGSLDAEGGGLSADVIEGRAPATPVSVIRQVVEATKLAIQAKLDAANGGPVRFYFGAYRPDLDRFYGSPAFLRRLQKDFPHTTLRREDMYFPHLGDSYPTYFADIHPTQESFDRVGAPAGEEVAPAPRSMRSVTGETRIRANEEGRRVLEGMGYTGVENLSESPDAVNDGQVRKWLRRNLTSQGDLPTEAFEAKLNRDAALRAIELEAGFLSKDFSRAIKDYYGEPAPDDLRLIDAAMKTKDGWKQLPTPLQQPVRAMRDHLDALSKLLISSGAVQGDLVATVEDNIGAYLTRSYQAFDDPKWKDKVDPEVVNRAVSFLRKGFEQAGDTRTEEELQGLVRSMLDKADSPLALIASGKLGSKDLSIFKRRKDIAPEIRALWGEYEDPMVNYTRSVAKMANVIANHEFLNEVKRAGGRSGWLAERPVVNENGELTRRLAAEGSSSLAPLNGMYTTPEIERAFIEAMEAEVAPDWLRAYMKVNGAVKFSKTVGSLMTHVRNLVGNTGFAVANGHWRLSKSPEAVRNTLGKLLKASDADMRKYTIELTKAGVIGQSARANELRDVIDDAVENGFMSAYDKGAAKRAKAIAEGVTEIYSAEDDVWKIFAYENELARYLDAGFPEAEAKSRAAKIVVNTYPTYSMVPTAIKKLRRLPMVGTFVSFPAEVLRTGWHTLNITKQELADPRTRSIGAQRLAGLVVAAGLPAAAGLASMALIGIDEDDDEDLRRFLPEWQKNAQLIYLGRDEEGNLRFVDASYTDPYSYLKKPIQALLQGESVDEAIIEAFGEVSEPFLGEEILLGKLIDVRRNVTDSGRPVYNPQAPVDDKVSDIMEHVWGGLEPGTLTSARRIWKAHTGTVEPWGRGYDTMDEVLAVATGQRRQTLQVAESLSFTVRRFNEAYRQGTQLVSGRLKSQGSVSQDQLADAYKDATAAHRSAFEEMHEDVFSAIRLGVTRKQALSTMRQAGMSKEMSLNVLRGRFIPWSPSKSTVTNILGTAQTSEKRAEFSRRIAQVRRLRADLYKEMREAQQPQ